MINTKKILKIMLIFIIVLAALTSKAHGANTGYKNADQKEEKGIGVAVAQNEGVDVNLYYYLFYDKEGEIHTVQYLQSQIRNSESKNREWKLVKDADISKAKELGAKEIYENEEELKKAENKEADELYKKIQQQQANVITYYEYIEGSQDNLDPYTIESVIFNQMPLLDANFFSETPGGKELKDSSAISIIRKLVAQWYVSFRNIALVALAFLIVYYGIRLAISTVASEKAVYKQILFGWLKSLFVVLFMHYIMFAMLNLNDFLVSKMSDINGKEGTIYGTIKTRATENPFKISFPAIVMYITLIIVWIRFLWSYTKRLFSIAFLIILEPLVVIKYAIESAKGKNSNSITNWIQKFGTNVFIQSIHALIYIIFVRIALEIALNNLYGFFIALFFLNFILTADKTFTQIFKFEFSPKEVHSHIKPFRLRSHLAGAYLTYGVTKHAIGFVSGVGSEASRLVGREVQRAYISATDALDDKYGGNHRKQVGDTYRRFADNLDNLIIDALSNNGANQNNQIEETGIKGQAIRILRIRKLARRRGQTGAVGKRALKLKSNARRKTFTSGFKIIRDIAIGSADLVFAIPVMATRNTPEAGFGMAIDAITRFTVAGRTVPDFREKERKKHKGIDSFIDSLNNSNQNMETLEKRLGMLSREDKAQAVSQLKKINKAQVNMHSLVRRINRYVIENDIREIDAETLSTLVGDIVDELPMEVSELQKEEIRQNAISIVMDNNREEERRAKRKETEEDEAIETHDQPIPENSGDQQHGQPENGAEATASQPANREEATSQPNNSENGEATHTPDRDREADENAQRNSEEQESRPGITYSFGEIAQAIEEAVIEETVDNRFSDLAKVVDNIRDINAKEEGKRNSYGRVVDINRFLDNI